MNDLLPGSQKQLAVAEGNGQFGPGSVACRCEWPPVHGLSGVVTVSSRRAAAVWPILNPFIWPVTPDEKPNRRRKAIGSTSRTTTPSHYTFALVSHCPTSLTTEVQP